MYPNEPRLDEARRILYYLVLTKDLGIRYIRGPAPHLYGMTESDRTTRRSTSGFGFFLGGKDCVSNDRTKHIERRHLKLVQEATTSVKYMASQY